LFAAAEPLDTETIRARIGKALDADKILLSLQKHYSSRGINLVCIKNKWSFRTSDDLSELMSLQKSTQKKLSKAAIETLAIIVYHQPVTRSEIEEIRGVAFASGTMEILLELNWVRPAGRKNVPGKPIQYATTDDFLSHFNLNNLSDLPNVEELSSAGLIDSSSIDSSIFGTKNYLEKTHSENNENLYSNIDQLIKGDSSENKKK
jgi:segregation and condensation protein B